MAKLSSFIPPGLASIPVSPRTQIPPALSRHDVSNVAVLNGPANYNRSTAIYPCAELPPASHTNPDAPYLSRTIDEGHAPERLRSPAGGSSPSATTNEPVRRQRGMSQESRLSAHHLHPQTTPSNIAPNLTDRTNTCRAMIAHLSWAEVKHYTNNVTLQDMSSGFHALLDDLDIRYIAIAIVREKGFVELLEREKKERETLQKAAPGYCALASKSESPGTRPVPGTRNSNGTPAFDRVRSFESRSGGYFPDMLGAGADSHPSILVAKAYESSAEPTTPRAETAVGQMFQNAAVKYSKRTPPLCSVHGEQSPTMLGPGPGVRRLQFEAAWKWIDEHVEEYVDKFASAEHVVNRSKRALWDELVGLRRRKEELDRERSSLDEPRVDS